VKALFSGLLTRSHVFFQVFFDSLRTTRRNNSIYKTNSRCFQGRGKPCCKVIIGLSPNRTNFPLKFGLRPPCVDRGVYKHGVHTFPRIHVSSSETNVFQVARGRTEGVCPHRVQCQPATTPRMGMPADRHREPYCRKPPRHPRGVQCRFFSACLCLGATAPLLSLALLARTLLSLALAGGRRRRSGLLPNWPSTRPWVLATLCLRRNLSGAPPRCACCVCVLL
jgi:hypothetical protein